LRLNVIHLIIIDVNKKIEPISSDSSSDEEIDVGLKIVSNFKTLTSELVNDKVNVYGWIVRETDLDKVPIYNVMKDHRKITICDKKKNKITLDLFEDEARSYTHIQNQVVLVVNCVVRSFDSRISLTTSKLSEIHYSPKTTIGLKMSKKLN
jgi:hypothetical protein